MITWTDDPERDFARYDAWINSRDDEDERLDAELSKADDDWSERE